MPPQKVIVASPYSKEFGFLSPSSHHPFSLDGEYWETVLHYAWNSHDDFSKLACQPLPIGKELTSFNSRLERGMNAKFQIYPKLKERLLAYGLVDFVIPQLPHVSDILSRIRDESKREKMRPLKIESLIDQRLIYRDISSNSKYPLLVKTIVNLSLQVMKLERCSTVHDGMVEDALCNLPSKRKVGKKILHNLSLWKSQISWPTVHEKMPRLCKIFRLAESYYDKKVTKTTRDERSWTIAAFIKCFEQFLSQKETDDILARSKMWRSIPIRLIRVSRSYRGGKN